MPGRSPDASSGTPHRVDLRGSFGQVTLGPAPAAVLAGEHLTAAGRAVHAPGLPLVEGESEDRGLGLDTHLDAGPARAAVGAAEQHAKLALEIRPGRHPDGLRIARDLADVAAVGLSVGIQRLEPGARPLLALVRAAEQTCATDVEVHFFSHASGAPEVYALALLDALPSRRRGIAVRRVARRARP